MGAVVVDASVLIGWLDPDDALHAASRLALAGAPGPLVLPASTFAEVLVGATRLGSAAVTATEAAVDDAVDQVRPLCRDVARVAAALRADRCALRLPDAFVIATGEVVEADAVLTGDRRWAGSSSRVRVVSG